MTNETKPLDGIFRFFDSYKQLVFYIIGFGAAPVLLDFIFAIGPPWPQSTGVAAFTSVVAWLVLLYSYSIWNKLKEVEFQNLIKWMVPLAFFALVLYIILKAFFVWNAPTYRNQEATGFILRPEIMKVLEANPGMTVEETFQGAEYNPNRIWLEWTVATTRSLLLLAWFLFFGSLSFVLSVFVLLQYFLHENSSSSVPETPSVPAK